MGYNPTGNGDTRNPVRPNWNPAFNGNLYPHTPNPWFNPQAFLAPATGTVGNVRWDSLVGVSLEFRAEFFNLLNHSNFLTPNPVVYSSSGSGVSPTAGVITATSTSSRQIQFGAKVQF